MKRLSLVFVLTLLSFDALSQNGEFICFTPTGSQDVSLFDLWIFDGQVDTLSFRKSMGFKFDTIGIFDRITLSDSDFKFVDSIIFENIPHKQTITCDGDISVFGSFQAFSYCKRYLKYSFPINYNVSLEYLWKIYSIFEIKQVPNILDKLYWFIERREDAEKINLQNYVPSREQK